VDSLRGDFSALGGAVDAVDCRASGSFSPPSPLGRGRFSLRATRKIGSFSRNFAIATPEIAAQVVAMMEVPTMAEGLLDLLAARIAIAVTGMSWTELVLSARKVHMALVAVPGRGFSDSRSFIARKPSGVAALPRPSMLAAMFMNIDPMAG